MPGPLTSTEDRGMTEHQYHFPQANCLSQWFSTGMNLPHRGHLAVSGYMFGCHNMGEGATDT